MTRRRQAHVLNRLHSFVDGLRRAYLSAIAASRSSSAWLYCKNSSRCEVMMLTVMGSCEAASQARWISTLFGLAFTESWIAPECGDLGKT